MIALRSWALFLIFMAFIEGLSSQDPIDEHDHLSKSLGYSMKRSADDPRVLREIELYKEMLRASKDSLDGREEDAQLENVVGRERAKIFKSSVVDRRRSVASLYSPVGRRRVRSQATRREKLNNQSLQSHRRHHRIAVSDNF